MIDEQSSASGHDYASDRSAIGAGSTLMAVHINGYTVYWVFYGIFRSKNMFIIRTIFNMSS